MPVKLGLARGEYARIDPPVITTTHRLILSYEPGPALNASPFLVVEHRSAFATVAIAIVGIEDRGLEARAVSPARPRTRSDESGFYAQLLSPSSWECETERKLSTRSRFTISCLFRRSMKCLFSSSVKYSLTRGREAPAKSARSLSRAAIVKRTPPATRTPKSSLSPSRVSAGRSANVQLMKLEQRNCTRSQRPT